MFKNQSLSKVSGKRTNWWAHLGVLLSVKFNDEIENSQGPLLIEFKNKI